MRTADSPCLAPATLSDATFGRSARKPLAANGLVLPGCPETFPQNPLFALCNSAGTHYGTL
jgi:hypothetical protein